MEWKKRENAAFVHLLSLWTFAECWNVFIGCFIHIMFHVSCHIIVGFFFLADFPSFYHLVHHLAQTMTLKWISHFQCLFWFLFFSVNVWNRFRNIGEIERERGEGEKTIQIAWWQQQWWPKFCELVFDDLFFSWINNLRAFNVQINFMFSSFFFVLLIPEANQPIKCRYTYIHHTDVNILKSNIQNLYYYCW